MKKMSTYKITNITDNLGKRDVNYNKTLKIDYVDDMMRKTIDLPTQEVVYLTTDDLPLSVHKLRVKNLVTVVEISAQELKSIINDNKPKKVEKDTSKKVNTNKPKKKSTTTTTTTKKNTSSTRKSTSNSSSSKSRKSTEDIYLEDKDGYVE